MNTGELQIERRTLGEITILDCTGRIIVRREAEFLFDAAAFAMERSRGVLLNLSGVSSVDVGGLGVLVLLKRMAGRFASELKLCSPNKRVSEMLKLTKLNAFFAVYRTEEDAIRDCFRSSPKPEQKQARCSAA